MTDPPVPGAAPDAEPDPGAGDAAPDTTMPGDDDSGAGGFRALFSAQFGAMVALARLLGSDDPEDTAQEAFARLHSRWRALQDPAAAVGYVRSTVVNLSRNRIRHLAVRRRHRGQMLLRPVEQPAADAEVLNRQRVNAALADLSARQREAIVLRYWLDLPFEDIAATVHRPAPTVRSDVRRGLARLATVLGDENDDATGVNPSDTAGCAADHTADDTASTEDGER